MAQIFSYESIMVVSCKLSEEEIKAVIERFQGVIEAHGTLESTEE